jgi:hypothetical protein
VIVRSQLIRTLPLGVLGLLDMGGHLPRVRR